MSPKLTTLSPNPFSEKKPPSASPPDPLGEEATVPVDVREMQAAAKASRFVPDPTSRPAGPREGGALPVPYAELKIQGDARVYELPAHRISATGLALEVPCGVSLSVREGTIVDVNLHLEHGSPGAFRLRARVAHHRAGKAGRPGGVALRWEPESAGAAAELDRIRAPQRP